VTKTRECISAHRASFRRAAAAGVRIAMGTDCGVGAHGQNARELRLMVEGGMTGMQAIVAATGNAAELLYPRAAPVGSVAPGKLADLLVVTANPLDDVSVLERPAEMVLITKNGVAHKSALPRIRREP
jgi:imidazolonepropionase-like amidohydrolase